ncbi:MAG TPA: aminodeoxychorismate synthase component I [Ilumatobacter sp.]|nr:aminodeoxychorismate synthase component I [Ilumatobacter sp.]
MIRLDDLTRRGASWVFEGPIASGVAGSLDRVVAEVAAAERAAAAGEWVVVVVAYEAAAAFDPAMRTAPSPPEGTPYVWWQSFAERTPAPALVHGPSPVTARGRRLNRLAFPDAVTAVRERIAAGDVYQVNVTDRFEGTFDGTPFEMYTALVGVQSCAYGAYVEMGDRVIASASPELFFRWEGPTVTCRPMKGTAPRAPRPADDARVAAELRSSPKEQAENVMIVDLLRNDLGRVARVGSVRVPELFTVERYETVWQLTSTVSADVPDGTDLVDVMTALFPCGSVTGAPKIAAMSVIAELECEPRGVYCGAIGVLAPPGKGPLAEFSVPIRTAVIDPATGTFEYGAGGGITWSSDPAAEDDEVRAKARILTRSRRDLCVISTLRHEPAGLVNLRAHLDRMEASAGWFGFAFDRPAIVGQLAALSPPARPERVRLALAADGALTVERRPLDPQPLPVTLAIDTEVTRSDDPYCCHKTTWRRHYDDARERHPSAADTVLVNEHGHAIETTIANLAYRVGDRWYCPPLTDGGLPGIARARALAEGRLAERSIRATDLHSCDELAVLNDLRGWRPAQLHTD